MEVLISIILFLVLGVVIVLASRDSDRKIRDLASDVRDLDKRIRATLFGDGKNEGALEGLKKTVGELSGTVSDLGKLTKRVEALETGKVNAGDVNTTVGVAINLVKGELRSEIAKKVDKSAFDALTEGVNALGGEIKSLTLEVEGVVETLNIAAKETRHKAGIFEPHELVAKELGVSEDHALALIKSLENDSNFALAAINAGIKLADVGATQQKIREIVTKVQGEVEAEEKKE